MLSKTLPVQQDPFCLCVPSIPTFPADSRLAICDAILPVRRLCPAAVHGALAAVPTAGRQSAAAAGFGAGGLEPAVPERSGDAHFAGNTSGRVFVLHLSSVYVNYGTELYMTIPEQP